MKSLKITLNEIGKETNWFNQIQISKHELQTEVKQKVNLLYDEIWTTELAKSTKGNAGNSKLRTYKGFKTVLKAEKYLSGIRVRAHRIALTKLRASAHQLRIETGRYQKLDEIERKCLLCNSGEIESEIHFVTQCSFFEKKRHTFFTFVSKLLKNFSSATPMHSSTN